MFNSSVARVRRAALAISVCATLCGCGGLAPTYQATTAAAARPARAMADVTVYTLPPTRPYTIVGYLHVRQEGWNFAPGPELLGALRDEAARRGCDAVVLDHGYCVEQPDRYSVRSATASVVEAYCVTMGGPG